MGGGLSTGAFSGGNGNSGEGGDGLGAAIFNLNGLVSLVHVTVANSSASGGTGATSGTGSGAIATVGYDSSAPRGASTSIRQSVVTVAGTAALYQFGNGTVADGTTNTAGASASVTGGAYVGSADPHLAALGNYDGPTRTMPPNPASPLIGAATEQGLTTTDQRGFNRDAAADLGAVEAQATTVTTTSQTIPFSASARNLPVSATVSPARGATTPGTLAFIAGALGSGTGVISGGSASATLSVPAGAAPGSYTLTATATSSPGFGPGSATATIKVLNAPQVCKDVSGTTAYQTAITVNTDCTGAGPVTVATTNPSHGTVSVVAGALKYTPVTGYIGSDAFTYTVTNEGGASNTATATIKVLNPPQVCKDVPGTTPYQTAITVNTDCTGAGPVTVAATNPSHGTVTVVGGTVRYTPAAGYFGTDSFMYKVSNEGGDSNVATATIKVLAPPQVCEDVSGTTAYQTAIAVSIDCTGAGPVTVAATTPSHGTVTVILGTVIYAPGAGYIGTDSFTYKVSNEGGASNTATATIKVLAPPPVCNAVSATTAYQTAVDVAVDCTRDGTVGIGTDAAHGHATVAGGKLRYTPNPGFNGNDSFTYTAANEGGTSNTAAVAITVGPPAPTCDTVKQTASAGIARTILLPCASIGAAKYATVGVPAHGRLSALDADAGKVVYTADDDYQGADSFTYRATNVGGDSAPATVTLDVTARPALTSTPSADITLGAGTLNDTITVSPRFEPTPGATIVFRLYQGGACTGTPVLTSATSLADDGTATSEPFTPTVAGTYAWQATYSGDSGNLAASGTCDTVAVKAPPAVLPAPQPQLQPQPRGAVPLQACGDPVVLLDVSPAGKKARLSGIARLALAGRQVRILRANHQVGTATVGTDGAFSAVVPGPGPGHGTGQPITYVAAIGANHSRAFRYDRRLRITKRSGLKITGKLDLKTRPKQVTVSRANVCTKKSTSTKAKVSKSGSFSFTMRGPDEGSPYVLYRVSAKLGGNGKTYSTQVAVAG